TVVFLCGPLPTLSGAGYAFGAVASARTTPGLAGPGVANAEFSSSTSRQPGWASISVCTLTYPFMETPFAVLAGCLPQPPHTTANASQAALLLVELGNHRLCDVHSGIRGNFTVEYDRDAFLLGYFGDSQAYVFQQFI